jgi:uncharacterized protein
VLRTDYETLPFTRSGTPAGRSSSWPDVTWVLKSPHAGDNSQLSALVSALGWPASIKEIVYRPGQTLARLALGATAVGVDRTRSSSLAPPWPDLVIGSGRANEAVALWIKRKAAKPVRLVYLGTPWAALDEFDLVITTPQYGLPRRSNVQHNALPLHAVTPARLASEAAFWAPRLAHLPRPWTALFVGGASGPYTFTLAAARRLAREAEAHVRQSGGSLLVTTSARTPPGCAAILHEAIIAPSYFFRWPGQAEENPFFAYLGLADDFIVTADSISMLAEACATGRPVFLFDIEEGRQSMRAGMTWLGRDLSTTAFRLAMRFGPARWSRDLRIVHERLIRDDRARWLGAKPAEHRQADQGDDMKRAVSRIRALFSA